MKRKRIGFAIGMMLLMGGWGLTWYADKQQQTRSLGTIGIVQPSGKTRGYYNPREQSWNNGVWIIYAAGIMLMTVGAGVTAFTLPLPEGWK